MTNVDVWDNRLTQVYMLKEGNRVLTTLSDARHLIVHLPEQRSQRPAWRYAAALLLRAAKTGTHKDITFATMQLGRALSIEGMLDGSWTVPN
jgi:hypothetical protein